MKQIIIFLMTGSGVLRFDNICSAVVHGRERPGLRHHVQPSLDNTSGDTGVFRPRRKALHRQVITELIMLRD